MFNTTQSKKSIIKFPVTLLQQILNASHVYLMKEINVCKIIRQKIYVLFYNTIWHQRTDVLFLIFHVLCTALFIVYFHTVISVFCTGIYALFVIDRTRKQILLIKWFNFVFTKDLPSVSQSNISAVEAEKEE